MSRNTFRLILTFRHRPLFLRSRLLLLFLDLILDLFLDLDLESEGYGIGYR